MDVDVIMSWPLDKLYGYMAYYLTQSEDFKEKIKDENLTPEQRTKQLMQVLGG